MYLGVTLSRLDDADNACSAYDKALELSPKDPLILLNYAATMLAHEETAKAQALFESADTLIQAMSPSDSDEESRAELLTQCEQIRHALGDAEFGK